MRTRMQAEVASKLSVFVSALLADWRLGQWEANMKRRAVWLRQIFESLGPAYIKIAQALSTRVDLVPDAYLEEFAKLQDDVPPFDTAHARTVIEDECGQRVDQVRAVPLPEPRPRWHAARAAHAACPHAAAHLASHAIAASRVAVQMFSKFSEAPVASASLGQVYQATLAPCYGGRTVAVKVQRPGILERVALDTLLMRQATEIVSSVPMYAGGWEEVLDDWAGRFFQVRAS
jgi:aarF domain-containing kinase